MGHDFFSKLESTFPCNWVSASNINVVLASIYAELRVCCSWDNKISQMCPLFCLNFCGISPTYTCSKQVLTNLVRWAVYNTDHLMFSLELFCVSTITLAHICIAIWKEHNKVFNLDLEWWRNLGAILWKINSWSWSYLHINGKTFLIHIYQDQGQYQSSQFSGQKTRAYAIISNSNL